MKVQQNKVKMTTSPEKGLGKIPKGGQCDWRPGGGEGKETQTNEEKKRTAAHIHEPSAYKSKQYTKGQ